MVTKVLADPLTRDGQQALRRCRSHSPSGHQPEPAGLFPDGRRGRFSASLGASAGVGEAHADGTCDQLTIVSISTTASRRRESARPCSTDRWILPGDAVASGEVTRTGLRRAIRKKHVPNHVPNSAVLTRPGLTQPHPNARIYVKSPANGRLLIPRLEVRFLHGPLSEPRTAGFSRSRSLPVDAGYVASHSGVRAHEMAASATRFHPSLLGAGLPTLRRVPRRDVAARLRDRRRARRSARRRDRAARARGRLGAAAAGTCGDYDVSLCSIPPPPSWPRRRASSRASMYVLHGRYQSAGFEGLVTGVAFRIWRGLIGG